MIGKIVNVDKIKNGYWVGSFKGEVLGVNETTKKVKVRHYMGNYWYSIKNVTVK